MRKSYKMGKCTSNTRGGIMWDSAGCLCANPDTNPIASTNPNLILSLTLTLLILNSLIRGVKTRFRRGLVGLGSVE